LAFSIHGCTAVTGAFSSYVTETLALHAVAFVVDSADPRREPAEAAIGHLADYASRIQSAGTDWINALYG
jgi:hypothetical protein